MRKVELHPAHLWTCDDCGRDNFERAIRVEPESLEGQEVYELTQLLAEEANESAEVLGIVVGGEWTMRPDHVKCRHCGAEFETLKGDHDEDDDGTLI
jgi:rubredoxin